MAEYQRGTGPDALPQGEATKLNENAAPPAQGPDLRPGARLQQDIPVEYGDPQPVPTNDPSLSDNMQLLTGPSDPMYKAPPAKPGRVPKSFARALPLLAVMSKNPDAPPAMKAMYRAGIAALEAENGEFD